jgi:hypothetical protein
VQDNRHGEIDDLWPVGAAAQAHNRQNLLIL